MSAVKILLVEDSMVVAKAMTLQLQRRGYMVTHVTEAAHARVAVHMAVPDRPNLIILDVGLPTTDPTAPLWDGLDFLEWLHWMNINIPVVIHSSTDPETIRSRHRNAHALAYLRKPSTPQEIFAAIEFALHQPAETDENATSRDE
jgi:DNA-binding response OmpR family regulator